MMPRVTPMPAIAPPPAHPSARVTPPVPPPRAGARDAIKVVQRVTMRDVPWETYESLVDANGDGPIRIAYDAGLMEIELPLPPHDRIKKILAICIESYGLTRGVPFVPTGSTTWKRRVKEAGLEADESYYVRNYEAVKARDGGIDLESDPPPDLALEVDLTHRSVDKLSIYARLGVPEVWRWDEQAVSERGTGERGRLVCLHLEDAGEYHKAEVSLAFPDLPLRWLEEAVVCSEVEGEYVAALAFRHRLATLGSGE